MIVTVDELKASLRLETDEDDDMLQTYIETAENACMDILRTEEAEDLTSVSSAKVAILYAAGYMYENRTQANMNGMLLTMRALLFSDRRDAF